VRQRASGGGVGSRLRGNSIQVDLNIT
jgi:hypothetical protein